MILFISGRCDIPAYYSNWLFKRFKAGFVDVRNPYNEHHITRIELNASQIDALVFCTKNPIPMLERLDEIPFPYLFQVTITPYHKDLEPHVLDKKQIIQAVKKIAEKIGKERVFLRYDPILINQTYTIEYHKKAYEELVKQLCDSVDRVIISFLDMYKNTRKYQSKLGLYPLDDKQVHAIAYEIGSISKKYGMKVQTCGEHYDLSIYGISQEPCVSNAMIAQLLKQPYFYEKKNTIRNCDCISFVDIGDYNACKHQCRYCYANYDEDAIQKRMKMHDEDASVLIGTITQEDTITKRKIDAVRQLKLL